MSNFWQRALTGVFFVAIIVGACILGKFGFLGILMVISIGCYQEFVKITCKKNIGLDFISWLGVLGIMAATAFLPTFFVILIVALFWVSLGIIILFSQKIEWKELAFRGTAIIYTVLPFSIFYAICNQNSYDYKLAINFFILVWSSDTFAYLCGKAFGKTKLFEKISPKKTWEGFLGGMILTMVMAYFLAPWIDIPIWVNVAMALSTVVFGTMGDLLESKLKRHYNLKDSGTFIPGHGGFLDRFDALLIAIPFNSLILYIYLSYF